MSTSHVVSRSVRDTAVFLDATHGPDLGAPYRAPEPARPFLAEVSEAPGRLRIAVQTLTFNGAPTHQDCASAVEDAAALCRELGHDVQEARLEIDAQTLGRATTAIITGNLRAALEDRALELGRELRQDDVEPTTWAMLQLGATATDYARAIRTIHAAGRSVARFLTGYDVILSPTMATPPLELGRLSLSGQDVPAFIAALNQTVGYTQLFNCSGHPAISLPLYWNEAGLPVGLQFAARFGDEATLLRLSAQLETARPWFEHRPAR